MISVVMDHACTTTKFIRQQARNRHHHAKTNHRHHQHPQHFVTRQTQANRRGGGTERHGVDGHDVEQRVGRQHDERAQHGHADVFGQQRTQRHFHLFFAAATFAKTGVSCRETRTYRPISTSTAEKINGYASPSS
jgi:hypothetical protein